MEPVEQNRLNECFVRDFRGKNDDIYNDELGKRVICRRQILDAGNFLREQILFFDFLEIEPFYLCSA